MLVKTVAILSPGDMGHAVGKVLGKSGLDVITCLAGRSQRTFDLAEAGNFRIVGSMEKLVKEADLILSILVPDKAKSLAEEVADTLRLTGENTYFADCNAVSPDSAKEIATIINESGGRYIDGGIIGSAPTKGDTTRFYVSGPDAHVVTELNGRGIIVKAIGDKVGQASGIKMCYAALTKGTNTLQVALLTAAQKMGLIEALREEFSYSQQSHLSAMERGIPRLPANSHRWIGEMEEISATFEALGVTPYFHMGAAEMYKLLNSTPFAKETPETIDSDRTVWETIRVASELIKEPKKEDI
tara:strand:- start:1049 stop:1948 length:900 start_codon:yes stop_codon:yes gene_type:complete